MVNDVLWFLTMPYKEKLKNPSPKPRKKSQYKVSNWSEYNKSLKKRGEVSLYFPPGEIKPHFVNEISYIKGISGQQSTYKQPYIELIYTFYRLFNWGIRQMTGFFEDLWRTKDLDIPVPSFGHLSDLFSSLPLKARQFCENLARRIDKGESISLIFDSTGLRFGKASHWYQTKYGKPCHQKPWRKMHLSMDHQMNVHGVDITQTEVADSDVMEDLIPDEIAILLEKVIADGGYYSKELVEKLYNKGIIPAIPPPSHAVVQGKDNTKWHDKIIKYIKDKGTVYAFHKKYGYGVRSRIEAQFSRIKRCIGFSLKTQRIESQKREGIIIGKIINKWNSFGQCVCVKRG
jgi:hypothetical protein